MNVRSTFLIVVLTMALTCTGASAKNPKQAGVSAQRADQAETLSLTGAQAIVAFSPNGDSTNVIVKAIDDARSQILVQAYGFTSTPIIKALVDAKERGVDVRVILDKSNESRRYSGATYLSHHRIPVWIDDSVAIAHNKVMVIDANSVITGSFNFTAAAQNRNAENVLLITHAPALAKEYSRNWQWRKELSHEYD